MENNHKKFTFGDLFQFKPRGTNAVQNHVCAKRQMESPVYSSNIQEIEVTCLDEDATPYATFQSHCQKVVSNENGLFLTYLKSRNEEYTAQTWRLLWSTDNGNSFKILYESANATNPPPIETDEENNIYLVYPDLLANNVCNIDVHSIHYNRNANSYFMIFNASDNYANPIVTPIKDSAGDKVCMIYDKQRKQFYYLSNNGTFHIIDRNGKVTHRTHIIKKIGSYVSMQYPQLSVDDCGVIHAAWTTELLEEHHYFSVQYMKTVDVGYTWKRIDGASLELPVLCDHEGDTDRITTDEEFAQTTWLSGFMAAQEKLHFIYKAVPHPDLKRLPDELFLQGKQHYLRYDIDTGEKDVEIEPEFAGSEISITGWDGFFIVDSRENHSPLFYVAKQGTRLACLVSHDNGISWKDFAISRKLVQNTFSIYAIGGCREVTKDGYIIGTFTEICGDRLDPFAKSKAHFIKIKVDG